MIDPTGTRYPTETRRVRTQIRKSTHGYGLKKLPTTLAGGHFLYPTRTQPVAIPNFGTILTALQQQF
jgi:hypothetical protein